MLDKFTLHVILLIYQVNLAKENYMKKEEVLKKARKENKQKDYALIEEENKAVKLAALSILILSCIYYVYGILIAGKTNYGFYSVIALYCTVVYGYKGIKLHNRKNIIISLIWLFVTILTCYSYFYDMVSLSSIL